ncbi:hypothetical protein [Chryseosolibacter indicus]|uniref:Uncharacterized protein n=1 Tax=Chryseosolibacter indicus TaxID=2782351 RepID=A0ABS5VKZ7_9BACT|nr:hypothetical protein [Chryseosolibacter indicus]MBT1701771.1 hypothetical protein [Chryseosolibacter indicus]
MLNCCKRQAWFGSSKQKCSCITFYLDKKKVAKATSKKPHSGKGKAWVGNYTRTEVKHVLPTSPHSDYKPNNKNNNSNYYEHACVKTSTEYIPNNFTTCH